MVYVKSHPFVLRTKDNGANTKGDDFGFAGHMVVIAGWKDELWSEASHQCTLPIPLHLMDDRLSNDWFESRNHIRTSMLEICVWATFARRVGLPQSSEDSFVRV